MRDLREALDELEAALAVPVFRVSKSIVTDAFDQLYAKLKPDGVTVSALLAKACEKQEQLGRADQIEEGRMRQLLLESKHHVFASGIETAGLKSSLNRWCARTSTSPTIC